LTGTVVTIAALIAGMNVDGNGSAHRPARARDHGEHRRGAVGLGTAMFLRTEQAGAVIQMPVFVIIFLAPIYVPLPAHRLDPRRRAGTTRPPIVLEAGARPARQLTGRRRLRLPAARRRRRGDGGVGAKRSGVRRARRLTPSATHHLRC
jgi:hypothetical protein